MTFLILVRHGQSIWNMKKRFTGWVDIDLTKKGELEAKKAGELIKSKNIKIHFFYSSLQLRAKKQRPFHCLVEEPFRILNNLIIL